MDAIYFKNANKNLGKPKNMTDKQCKSLWVYSDGRECISCWKLSIIDRIKILFHGKMWLFVLSGNTQPPVSLMVDKDIFK